MTELKTESMTESEKSEKEDFGSIGKEIMYQVSQAPRSCRMGDIYHRIK